MKALKGVQTVQTWMKMMPVQSAFTGKVYSKPISSGASIAPQIKTLSFFPKIQHEMVPDKQKIATCHKPTLQHCVVVQRSVDLLV